MKYRYTIILVTENGIDEVDAIIDANSKQDVLNKVSRYGVVRDVRPATPYDIKISNLKSFKNLVSEIQTDTLPAVPARYNWSWLGALVLIVVLILALIYWR
jgi:hypothetical protein